MGRYVQLSDGKRVYVDFAVGEESASLAFNIATEDHLSPEEFARALATPGEFKFLSETLAAFRPKGSEDLRRIGGNVARFYVATRKLRHGRSRAGRFANVYKLGRPIDFAILVCYFRSVGIKQAFKAVGDYWVRAGLVVPTKSKQKPAQRRVNTMIGEDLPLLAKLTRVSLGIKEPLPIRKGGSRGR